MDIVFYVYNGMTMLDAIGPYELLRSLSDVNVIFVAKEKGEIASDSKSVFLNIKYGIDEVSKADILIIPGSTIAFIHEMNDKKVLDWIKAINETTQKTVSVCTGSIILAATGLLKGKKATSHWKTFPLLEHFGIMPTKLRVVEDGKFITAAGVSAGIDMALYLAREIRGENEAKAAQLAIEYDPNPIFRSGNFLTAEPEIIHLANKKLELNALREISLKDMIRNVGTLIKLLK